jgi:hypothetical protein
LLPNNALAANTIALSTTPFSKALVKQAEFSAN